MNISFHTGKSAMIAQGKALDIYGNNIANVNTVGYQTLRPDFADCIYETERRPEADWQTGHGTYIQKTDLMFAESHFQETDRPQDMAIAGEGFFAVEDRWGNVNYTRDGKFGLTQLDGVWYLVSSQGEYVLDYDKQRIEVPFEDADKNTILAGLNWDDVRGQIGTFTVDGGRAMRIRYDYSGVTDPENPPRVEDANKQMTHSETDPPTEASMTADGYYAVMDDNGTIRYTRDPQISIQSYNGKWVIGSVNGGYILGDNLQPVEARFVPDPSTVDTDKIQLNENNETAFMNAETGEIEFKEVNAQDYGVVQDGNYWYLTTADNEFIVDANNQRISVPFNNGDYFGVDWDNAAEKIGVFAPPLETLSTADNTRYDTAAAADQGITKTAGATDRDIILGNVDGFMAVESADGAIRYTRNAKLDIMQDDTGVWYLSTPQGEYVLDYNNQRIQVSEPQFNGNVDWAGVHELVGVFEFPNPYGIDALGSNRYLETDRSGEAVACRVLDEASGEWVYTMDKIPNALIASNVELSDQMVKLIETQRAYQLSSRVVTTSDELARISNNLR